MDKSLKQSAVEDQIDPEILKKLEELFPDRNLIKNICEALIEQGVNSYEDMELVKEEDFKGKNVKPIQARKLIQSFQTRSEYINYQRLSADQYNLTQASGRISARTYQDEERKIFDTADSRTKFSRNSYNPNPLVQLENFQRLAGVVEDKTPIAGSKLDCTVNGLEIYEYPKQDFSLREAFHSKNILLVGPSGSGKTTFLEFLLNYVSNISIYDKFRYSLPELVKGKNNPDQAQSQTQRITTYLFRSQRNDLPNLRVIDTPGFEDTGGIQKDEENIQNIKQLFQSNDIHGLHLLCLVMQSTTSRLTPAVKYVYSRILELFASDLKSNIVFLITFADSANPIAEQVIYAPNSPLKELTRDNENADSMLMKFNNSALRGDPNSDEITAYWNMGVRSFEIFFDRVKKSKEIGLKETIKLWKLKQQITDLMPAYHKELLKAVNAKSEFELYKKRVVDCDSNYFDQILELLGIKEEDDIENAKKHEVKRQTVCKDCKQVCCSQCALDEAQVVQECKCIIYLFDRCSQCKHNSFNHFQRRIPKFEGDSQVISPSIQDQIDELCIKCDQEKQILNDEKEVKAKQFQDDTEEFQKNASTLIELVTKLEEIQLKSFTVDDKKEYYKIVIENETKQKAPGWQERVKNIEDIIFNEQQIDNIIERKGEVVEVLVEKRTGIIESINDTIRKCSIF